VIAQAIHSILSADAPLVAIVGTRIKPAVAPQETANPCVIFEISSQDPNYTKDGAAEVIFTFLEIDIFSNTHAQAWTIEGLVKAALDQYSGTQDGQDIDLVQWEGSDDRAARVDRGSVAEYQVSMGFRIRTK